MAARRWAGLRGRGPLLLLLGLAAAAALWARRSGALQPLDLAAHDLLVRARQTDAGPAPPVVLIGVTEEDITSLRQWPLTDATLARALRLVCDQGPRAVGVDIYRDLPVPPGSDELDAVFSAEDRIIGIQKFGAGGVPPPPKLQSKDQVGFGDMVVDDDGVVRRGLLFQDEAETVGTSLALRLAALYLAPEGLAPGPSPGNPDVMALGAAVLDPLDADFGGYVGADAGGYQILLDYRDRHPCAATYSLGQLLSGEVPAGALRDKVVLVGVVAQSVKDSFLTPVDAAGGHALGTPGVLLHAAVVAQLVRAARGQSAPVRSSTEGQELALALGCAAAGAALGLWRRSPWRLAALGTAGIGLVWAGTAAAYWAGWWVPLAAPSLAWLGTQGVGMGFRLQQERRERATLMQLFSKHVAPEVARAIWEQRETLLAGGRPRSQELPVTILFSDLRGFTSVSELLSPTSLVDWLNTYMDAMTRLVMAHSGVVDDYAGDGIKANFGVPIARGDEAEVRRDAANAVRCALAMRGEAERLNRLWADKGLPGVGVRVGICSGPVVAGALGSSERLKYTTVGDTVNTAARLESFEKEDARDELCRILVSGSTLALLADQFESREIGILTLRGKKQGVAVHQIVGERNHESRPEPGRTAS